MSYREEIDKWADAKWKQVPIREKKRLAYLGYLEHCNRSGLDPVHGGENLPEVYHKRVMQHHASHRSAYLKKKKGGGS